MELIDRVIKKYNGVWPEFDFNDCEQSKQAIVISVRNWYCDLDHEYYSKGDITLGGTAADPKYCKVICTKDQFEQRVLELSEDK